MTSPTQPPPRHAAANWRPDHQPGWQVSTRSGSVQTQAQTFISLGAWRAGVGVDAAPSHGSEAIRASCAPDPARQPTASTGRVERRELDGDGSFVWPLAPGVYQIAGFQAYAPLRVGRVWASFTVADAGRAVIQPVGSEQGAPLVDSLTPRLEWRPAPRAGLTYDVAVYESIVLNPMPGATRTLRGPVAAYAQALAEPHWQVSPPLPADRRYEWSVRLREGDNVSTWSTTGYFAFFVVGFASGSGNWFGFTTPKR